MADYTNVAHPGDSNEITRRYLDSLLIEERLIGSDLPDVSFRFGGKIYETPIMDAAFSHADPWMQDGSVHMAEGFRDAGALNWWGMCTNEEFGRIAATGADTIRIIKPYADEKEIFSRIAFAKEHGAVGVGIDIDHAYSGNGTYDNVLGQEMRPKTVAQLREYVKAAEGLPYVVKGVLSVQDAVRCVEAGASAIQISHHHGILRYAVPPLAILPEIRKAVGSEVLIFVDCGMDSASDVFKALALGADAVSVSRHILDCLKAGSAAGVTAEIRKMTAELKSIMARTGSKDIHSIDPDVIVRL